MFHESLQSVNTEVSNLCLLTHQTAKNDSISEQLIKKLRPCLGSQQPAFPLEATAACGKLQPYHGIWAFSGEMRSISLCLPGWKHFSCVLSTLPLSSPPSQCPLNPGKETLPSKCLFLEVTLPSSNSGLNILMYYPLSAPTPRPPPISVPPKCLLGNSQDQALEVGHLRLQPTNEKQDSMFPSTFL